MPHPACIPADHPAIGRRTLLQAGGIGLLGTGLGDLLRLEAQGAEGASVRPKAKSVVFIFQSGGPSQHETFDPKPEAPAEVRGEYGTTATRLAGFRICEYLPQLAARANQFSIVRTMSHPAPRQFRNEHVFAQYMIQSGTCDMPPGENSSSGLARLKSRRTD